MKILSFISIIGLVIVLFSCTFSKSAKRNNVLKTEQVIFQNLNQKFYESISNPVEIHITNIEYDSIGLNSPFAEFSKVNGREYFIFVPSRSGEIWLTLKAFKLNNCVYQDSLLVDVLLLPNPVLALPVRENKLSKNALLQKDRLSAVIINLSVEVICEVQSFEILVFKDGNIHRLSSENKYLSPEQKDIISKSGIGDYIIFENVIVTMPNGAARAIPPSVYKITK